MTHVQKLEFIGHNTALSLVGHAIDHAAKNGWQVAVAVTDSHGNTVAGARMDGAHPALSEFAADKAYTSGTQGRTTKDFYARMSQSPDDALGLANRSRLTVWEGGLPIRLGGALIGGIGVSGAKGHEDVACARAALMAVGLAD
jgi:glc operon protein GlcG